MAEHVFPQKAGQTQKRYMCRSLQLVGEMTVNEWVALVLELNKYLKDFPTQNGNKIQPLDKDTIMDILECGVPASWHRDFTVQGFDPLDQGLKFLLSSVPVWSYTNPVWTNPRTKVP
eukprot:818617-Ditylum_brightwellii.AAC.2